MSRKMKFVIICFAFMILFCLTSCDKGGNNVGVQKKVNNNLREAYRINNPRVTDNDTTWDVISLGSYWYDDTNGDWRVDPDDEKQTIEWRVLAVNDTNGDGVNDEALLLSDNCLDTLPFDNDKGKACYLNSEWESCFLRDWLNNIFYEVAFSSEEKTDILEKTISTEGGKDGQKVETRDKIFLLSFEDVRNERYGFESFSEQQYKNDQLKSNTLKVEPLSIKTGDLVNEVKPNEWWLRSPGKHFSGRTLAVVDNWIVQLGHEATNVFWVRPAMYVKIPDAHWKMVTTVSARRGECD